MVPRRAFSQVLRGLIDNARDASPAGAPVSLRVRAGRGGLPGQVTFEVADRGTGIPADVLAHIGEPFFTTKPAGKGMGLGVFLARTVIERLGGQLAIRSTPGEGTSATVSHSCRGRPMMATATAGGALLLVDDDEVFRERLARALRDRGYDVATAGDHAQRPAGGAARVSSTSPSSICACRRARGSSLIEPLRALAPRGADPRADRVRQHRVGHRCAAARRRRLPVEARRRRRDHGRAGDPGPRPAAAAHGRSSSSPRRRWRAPSGSTFNACWPMCGGNISEAARRLGITRRRCSSSSRSTRLAADLSRRATAPSPSVTRSRRRPPWKAASAAPSPLASRLRWSASRGPVWALDAPPEEGQRCLRGEGERGRRGRSL